MKFWQAYLDGWRVLARVLAFCFCAGLFGIPFALAWMVAGRVDGSLSTSLYIFASVVCLPVAAYLGSWYSGEFRLRLVTEDEGEAGSSEESEF